MYIYGDILPSTSVSDMYSVMFRYNSVTIATGYGQDSRGSILGRGKEIFLYSTAARTAHIPWIPWDVSPGIKLREREAYHSPISSAEVKNGGAVPPLPHISPRHGA
jgi:hypothetical protein